MFAYPLLEFLVSRVFEVPRNDPRLHTDHRDPRVRHPAKTLDLGFNMLGRPLKLVDSGKQEVSIKRGIR